MIEFVTDLGIWSIKTLAQPVIIWTVFALLFWLWIRIKTRFHSVTLYGFQVALILALPLSIISAALLSIPLGSPQISEVYTSITLTYSQIQTPLTESTTSVLLGFNFWIGCIALISLTFFLLFLIRSVVSFVILAIWKRKAISVTNSDFSTICDDLFQHSSLKRPPKIAFSSDVRSPLTYGWFQPVILLPLELKKDQDFRMAVQHELIHIQRADFAIHLFVSAVRSLFVWHPLVHLLARSIARNREISCDSKVLAESKLPSNVYAGLLLNYASISNKRRSVSVAMSEPPIKLVERIKAMQDQHNQPESYSKAAKMAFWGTPLLLSLIFLISACDFGTSSQNFYNVNELDQAPELLKNPLIYLANRGIRPDDHSDYSQLVAEVFIKYDGKVSNVNIVNGNGTAFENHFKNALSEIPWSPGLLNGKAVDSRINIPFDATKPFVVVEDPPSPVGGLQAIFEHLNYPEEARKNGIEGVVVVQFIVDRHGNSHDFHILRSLGNGLDEAAVEAISAVSWNPGKQRGRAVEVQFQVPIRFALSAES